MNSAMPLRFLLIIFPVLCLLGCKPSAREVAAELKKIPLGIPRKEVYEEMHRVYAGKLSKTIRRNIEMHAQSSPQLSTRQILEVTELLIQGNKQRNQFVVVYPEGLFRDGPPAYFDAVGLATESTHGNGGVTLYYDIATNYIGFVAHSIEKVSSK